MKNRWNRLDNAAKIFPSSQNASDTQVFRFSCELLEEVDPDALQKATDETLAMFEIYRSVMKRGIFWYYLEETTLSPVVRNEYKPPCAPLYSSRTARLLFEVTYYRRRINLEVYHVLSDGTGAMNFLRTLVCKYLAMTHGFPEPLLDYDASPSQLMDDSFCRYYSDAAPAIDKKKKDPRAYRLRGPKCPEHRLRIISVATDVDALLSLAHEKDVSMTVYLTASLMWALAGEMRERERKRPVTVEIPINLRNFFPSESARNFFAVIRVIHSFRRDDITFDEVLTEVARQFREKITLENMRHSINSYSAIERNLFARIVPLALKDIVLRIACAGAAARCTAAISNLGIVKMPEEAAPYIRSFDVCTGTEKLQICACSFGKRLTMDFTAPFLNTDVQRRFLRQLTAAGLEAEVTVNFSEGEV